MSVPLVQMRGGNRIPQVGFGLYRLDPDDTERVVEEALAAGYRHFDSAAVYRNEAAVGRALHRSGVPREDLFVTSKVWNSEQLSDQRTIDACRRSLEDLGLDWLDLYLVHWPAPRFDRYVQTWDVLQQLRADGLVRSVGVSNFEVEHLDRLAAAGLPTPEVDQVELHPYYRRDALVRACRERGIVVEAWGPLAQGRADLLVNPSIVDIARRHGRTPAQVVLRWHVQRNHVVFPKSSSAQRMRENLDLFDFSLSPEDLSDIDALERGERMGAHSDEQH